MRYNGIDLQMADELIMSFFEGDMDAVELFVEIASHMVELAPKAQVRANSEILGVASPNERYRFYVSKKDGIYSIKYKHNQILCDFSADHKNKYLTYNTECNAYFNENPELVSTKRTTDHTDDAAAKTGSGGGKRRKKADKSIALDQWAEVVSHAESAIDIEQQEVSEDTLRGYYSEIIGFLTRFADATMDERDSDVIKRRVLTESDDTLQKIGDKYGISRERIRQLENKRWRASAKALCIGNNEMLVPWREELCGILLNIDVSHFLVAMSYVMKENMRVGEMLIKASTPTYRSDEYRDAISKSGLKEKFKLESGQRVPSEIVDEILKLDLAERVRRKQPLVEQGDLLRGDCLRCACNSFVVYPDTNSFYCFSCKKGGNIISYLTEYEGLEYRDAIVKLAGEYHIGETEVFAPRSTVMRTAALFYHSQLKSNPEAAGAIDVIHSWGIYGRDIVRLGLGFCDKSASGSIKYLNGIKGISIESLARDNIIHSYGAKSYIDRMRNAIILPTTDLSGNVVCFDAYLLNRKRFLYYPPCQGFYRSNNLYSLNLAVKSGKKSVVVVFDYPTYFALMSKGMLNVVSAYMVHLTQAQVDLLKKHFKAVILISSGKVDSSQSLQICRDNGMKADLVIIPDTRDTQMSEKINDVSRKIANFESEL